MRTQSVVVAAALAASMLGGTASGALAGEVTGRLTPTRGLEQSGETASICRFSGRNDELLVVPGDPVESAIESAHTQSFGTIVRILRSFGFEGPPPETPADSCNKNAEFAE